MKEYAVIGKDFIKKDALEKVTGTAKYVGDMKLLNMLHGAVKLSTIASGSIKNLNVSKALALEGVVCVLTAKDLDDPNLCIGAIFKHQPIFAYDRIRRYGDIIAAVAAETVDIAREAIDLIEVEYEETKGIYTVEDALKEGAVPIHGKSNMGLYMETKDGDVDEAFKTCDVIVENEYKTPVVQHMYIEPEACLADYDKMGSITVWGHSHNPLTIGDEVSRILNIPYYKVRAISPYIGGSFGGKATLSVHCQAALLSQRTGRPVRIVLNREESTTISPKRHPMFMKAKTGADKNGKLIASDVELFLDSGAYDFTGVSVALKALTHCLGPYDVPNLRIKCSYVYTNNPANGAFRGYGVTQVAVCSEGQMDALANKLGMSKLEIRKINAHKTGSKVSSGQVLEAKHQVHFLETLDACVEKSKEVISARDMISASPTKKRGAGIGCGIYGVGYPGKPNPSSVFLEVNHGGLAYLRTCALDFGQGSMTTLTQIVADTLGMNYDDVFITYADTGAAPDSGSSSSSRQSFITGSACVDAAQNAKKIILPVASQMLNINEEKTIFRNGKIYEDGNEENCVSFKDAMGELKKRGIMVVSCGTYSPTTYLDAEFRGAPYEQYVYSTDLALVEVDIETGKIDLIKVISSNDIGRIVSPKGFKGQIDGGVSQGRGYALLENSNVKNGKISNLTYSKYMIETAMDIPEIHLALVESDNPSGKFIAKGIGEMCTIPVAPAIVSAVEDAIGIRFNSLPISPADVLKALREKK